LAGSRIDARLAKGERTENSSEPRSGHGNARHEQLFHPLELEASVTRPLIELDPRHALIPNRYFQHGALHSAHPDRGQWERAAFLLCSRRDDV
jgi:hypothetical protein